MSRRCFLLCILSIIDIKTSGSAKKLGETGKKIETVRGIGYRMADS